MAEVPPIPVRATVSVTADEEMVRAIVRNELATALETVVTALAAQLKGSV